jgi:hypothetical protein
MSVANVRTVLTGALALSATLALGTPLAAQELDARWLPFMGCWEPVNESADEVSLLCVVPSDAGPGVEMRTIVDGELVSTETITADGAEHERTVEGCTTVERAHFSERAGRVYQTSEEQCAGQYRGTSSAMLAMVTPYEWLDVQVVQADGGTIAGVLRYSLASLEVAEEAGYPDIMADRARAVRAARVAASRAPTVDDVLEAYSMTDPQVVQAWVAEQGEPLQVDGHALVRMADAGVPPQIIDMVVAVSFPERFAIERGIRGELAADALERDRERGYGVYGGLGFRRWGWAPFYSSFWYSPFYYSPYSAFGYGGYGGYGYGYWGYAPRIVRVDPGPGSVGGRAVRGRGYTRSGGSQGAGAAVGRSGSGGSSGSVSGSSGSSGSSKSTGRKAKRRGG